MATCKDCHNCAFDLMCTYIGDWVGIRTPCPAFKDKSRFVELPCHTGEKVLVAYLGRKEATRTKEKGEVIGFHITESLHVYTSVILEDGSTFAGIYGKNIFPRKEELEESE